MDCSLPGSSIHGIFQARVLEWSAIAFSDIPNRMDKIQNTDTTKCWQGSGTTGTLTHCWRGYKIVQPLWAQTVPYPLRLCLFVPCQGYLSSASLFLPVYYRLYEGRNLELLPSINSLEKAMAPHSSALAWKIPWTEEPGRLQSMGSLRVRHD